MDIENEILNLQTEDQHDTDSDLELFKKSNAGRKKKKKGKLANYSMDSAFSSLDDDGEGSLLSALDFKSKKKKTPLGDNDIFASDDDSSKKDKAIENKFKPEIAQLTKLLRENESTVKLIHTIIDPIVNSKSTRASAKGISDLIGALNTANGNRLSTIREMGSLKKAILDLKMKAKREDHSTDLPMDQFGSRVFEDLFTEGRASIIDRASSYQNLGGYEPSENKSFDALCEERLSTETNTYRSDEGNKMIQYESRNPEICITKSFNTSEIQVVAIDSDGVIIPDYPVPPIENLGKLTFNTESGTATDITGRVFKVIDVE